MWRSGMAPRPAHWLCLFSVSAVLLTSCAPELEKLKQTRGSRGSVGDEVYKSICRRVAGTEMPTDLDGRLTEDLCLGDAELAEQALDDGDAAYPARLKALAQRRDRLVQAVNTVLPNNLSDEFEQLARKLLPFYDPPAERIQQSTRALAAFLATLSKNESALSGLERLGRVGMLPPEHNFGVYRAMLAYSDISKVLGVVLPVLTEDKEVKPYFETVLKGLALELATSELDDAPDSDTQVLKDLLTREHPDFATGEPLFTAVRDRRGLPKPTKVGANVVPFPFVDGNGDGLADEKGGKFVMAAAFGDRELPEPFPTRDEPADTRRDMHGQALGFDEERKPSDTPLYVAQDADRTVLAGMMREAGKMFDEETQIAKRLAKVFPVLFGDRVPQKRPYGKLEMQYQAPDTDQSPAIDLVHAMSVLVDRPVYDESLDMTKRLLADHEPLWARTIAPLLTLEKRTRKGSDAYPNAKLAKNSILWDELLEQGELLSRQRISANGETAVEAMMRGQLGYVMDNNRTLVRLPNAEALKHLGGVTAVMMRYKDEWRGNPRSESKRGPGEDATRGFFRTPVDRTRGDTPVTCGRDGCGGLIKGTPFEDWAPTPGQFCMIQRRGRPGKDCGQAANQSLYQRSLGLVWEMAGRSQDNKVITVRELLEFALPDPCLNLAGAESCTMNSQCEAARGSADYVCDQALGKCVAKRGSQACSLRRQQDQASRDPQLVAAEATAITDYQCPLSAPSSAQCKSYLAKYPSAFIDPDGIGPLGAGIQVGHLMSLPDVGRVFGFALTGKYRIEIPNPWVWRYLTEVALAAKKPKCAMGAPAITAPWVADPDKDITCVRGTASDSRAVYTNMPASVDTLGELMEFLLDDSSLFQGDADTAALRPDVKALSRVLFAPTGGTSSLLFDPILVRNAPAICTAAQVSAGLACPIDDTAPEPAGCCIKEVTDPPLRYRLETFYGATTFSWEYPITFADGSSLSFIDSMRGLADAINRTDYTATDKNPADNNASDYDTTFENKDYPFTVLGELIAQHYDSPRNTSAQNKDPKKPTFRYLTNMVSYEPMIADAVDDGMINDPRVDPKGFDAPEQQLGLIYHSFDILEVLDELTFEGGRDGIDVSADLVEHLLSPHAGCGRPGEDKRVVSGKGACDRVLETPIDPNEKDDDNGTRLPISYRNGTFTICWNDGRCFNGTDNPRRFVSPAYLAADAVSDIDDRINADPEVDQAFSDALAAILDTYAQVEDDQLVDRRLRALLIVGTDFMRDRIRAKKDSGNLRKLPQETLEDAIDIVRNPLFAGGLDMLKALLDEEEALDELTRFYFALLDDSKSQKNLRDLLAASADLVQSLPGDGGTTSLLQAIADSILPGVLAGVQEGTLPASVAKGEDWVPKGVVWQNATLSRDTVELDGNNTLGRVFQNLVIASDDLPYTPLETFMDALTAINRVDPSEKGVMSSRDWSAVTRTLSEVMLDERRGLERLYRVVQCRNKPVGVDGCE